MNHSDKPRGESTPGDSDELAETIAGIAEEAIREARLHIPGLPPHRRAAVRNAVLLAALKGINHARKATGATP